MFGWIRRTGLAWRQALYVLLAGVMLSTGATWALDNSEDAARRRSLELDSLRLANDLRAVVPAHTALLSALRSLYRVNEPLTRAQFHNFVIGGKLLDQHPGAQAYEFARRVPAADLATYESSVQATVAQHPAYPLFDVHPASTSEDLWVVEYLEPIVRNEAAFGLDLGAEPSRRQAVEAACMDDRPAATPPIRLVQEHGNSRGLVVLSPVYDVDTAPATPAERWAQCVGLMIVVYRVDDIMATLRRQNVHIGFELTDLGVATGPPPSHSPDSAQLLFDTDVENKSSGAVHRAVIEFHGRYWEIAVNESATPIVGVAARTIGLMGVAFSVLVSGLVLQLATFRRRALTRGRLVAAGDRDRRSLERDLHDGAQARLLNVSLLLAEARQRLPDSDTDELLSTASAELRHSLQELRDVAHGLHPAVLTNHGLAVAVEGVAAQALLPVELHLSLPNRLPTPIEAAAYYVVCEVVTNAVKHAMATRVRVSICEQRKRLSIDVHDDGVGGARVRSGSGLRGLADRVEALDGRFRLRSPHGRGTWIHASIPFE